MYKKEKYIILKLCVSVWVLLLMWVPQVVAHNGGVCGDCWDFKPVVEVESGTPLTARLLKASWPISLAARVGHTGRICHWKFFKILVYMKNIAYIKLPNAMKTC